MTKNIGRTLLPFITGVVIIGAAGILINLYRSTWIPGKEISPVLPRAQFSFSVRLPENHSGRDLPLLLRIVKDRNAFLSVSYWHAGRTVFQMPIIAPPSLRSDLRPTVRLALWDPGRYTLTFADSRTGVPVESLSFQVAAPIGLYRNNLILLALLAVAGYLSGRMALDSLPLLRRSDRILSARKVLFSGLLVGGLLLILTTNLTTSAPVQKQSKPSTGFHESEGRIDAPRMLLPLSTTGDTAPSGYLILRHRLDSWLRFGQDLTLFEGPIEPHSHHQAFILPPDDGRYRLSLWTGQTGSLTERKSAVQAIPVSPIFPMGLFLGLTLFSSSFFLLGFTGTRRTFSGAMKERLH